MAQRTSTTRSRTVSVDDRGESILTWFIGTSFLVAVASVPLVFVMWLAFSRHPWFLVLAAVVATNAMGLMFLQRVSVRLGPARTLETLCAVQWGTAVVITWIEPWSLHITPLATIAPLAVAPSAINRQRLAGLATAGTVVLVVITIIGRFTAGHGLHPSSSLALRNAVSVGWVTVFAVAVSTASWHSYGSLSANVDRLDVSRRRALGAAERSRRLFEQQLVVVRGELDAIHRNLTSHAISNGRPPTGVWLEDLQFGLRRAMDLVRDLGHGLIAAAAVDDDVAEAIESVGRQSPYPVGIRYSATREIPHEVASALVAIVAEATAPDIWRGRPMVSVEVEVRQHGSHEVVLCLRFREGRDRGAIGPMSGIDPDVVDVIGDHAAACDGFIERVHANDRAELLVRFPLGVVDPEVDRRGNVTSAANLSGPGLDPIDRAFRPVLVFPVLMPLVAATLAVTVLRSPIMVVITGLAICLYTVPAFVAIRIAPRNAFAAGLICSVSAAVVGAFVVSRLNFVRLWAMPLLFAPSLAVLPYVTRRAFALLTTLAAVGTVVVFSAGRLGREDPVAERSSELLNDLIAVSLVPAAFGMLVLVLHRNQTGLLAVSAALRRARRRSIIVMAETRRQLERDLHDGAQQRLLSAGIRLQIVQRARNASDVAQNLSLATDELGAAITALADVESIAAPAALRGGGLADTLRSTAAASPADVVVDCTVPDTLDPRMASAIYLSCCECLTNSVKHGGPDVTVRIEVHLVDETVDFFVVDDGPGFAMIDTPTINGTGLRNIRHRVGALGGELTVTSDPGGTTVHGRVPVLMPPAE